MIIMMANGSSKCLFFPGTVPLEGGITVVICLTATLPSALEASWIYHLGDPTVCIVRTLTGWPHVLYNISMYVTQKEAESEILRHIKVFEEKLLQPGDSLLVLCRSILQVYVLKEQLPDAAFWHGLELRCHGQWCKTDRIDLGASECPIGEKAVL
jgi:hypothetical protein